MVQENTMFRKLNGLHGSKYLVLLPLHFQQAVLCLQSTLPENYGTVVSALEDA
jgi:hypothetical protein